MKAKIAALTVTALVGAAMLVAFPTSALAVDGVNMNRMYNPYSGEHLYTASDSERANLVSIGWKYEGTGWVAPATSDTPVYRLYNPYSGDHHYTMDRSEYNYLGGIGWLQEGIGWYSNDNRTVVLYRQYNPYAQIGTHNYTTSKSENDYLATIGWRAEGMAWYGMAWKPGYTETIEHVEYAPPPIWYKCAKCDFQGDNADEMWAHLRETMHGSYGTVPYPYSYVAEPVSTWYEHVDHEGYWY